MDRREGGEELADVKKKYWGRCGEVNNAQMRASGLEIQNNEHEGEESWQSPARYEGQPADGSQ